MPSEQSKGAQAGPWAGLRVYAGALLLCTLLCGCATSHPPTPSSRPFNFNTDTFAYANELLWVYHYDTNGNTWTESRVPRPNYTLHCFVVARSAAQFFENARFEPERPVADKSTYRRLIRKVVSSSLRHPLPAEKKLLIPGYANLREFSMAHEDLLKEECGSAWESYLQRGHWRMVFPFSRHQQEATAQRLVLTVKENRPAVVHVAKFPQLSINHALVVFAVEETPAALRFSVYDPNEPSQPGVLTYERAARRFYLPPNKYFRGGQVSVYQVYHAWNY